MKNIILASVLLFSFVIQMGCEGNDNTPLINPDVKSPVFQNPRAVTVQDYSGDLMEPAISRDGQILFFNNLNADLLPSGAKNDTNLHYATKIDEVTFEYKGEVNGANLDALPDENELEGVASMDKNNTLFFVNTSDYFDSQSPNYLSSLFFGNFENGTLTNIQRIANLKTDRPLGENPVPGEVNFDAEIHSDGIELYFVAGIFSGSPFPDEANIGIAIKENGIFKVHSDSENLFAKVNSNALEYAPSISTNRLEFYFSRATGSVETGVDFEVYVATRKSDSDPWGNVERLEAIVGEITEAPSISFDGKLLYYHQKTDGLYKIYVVERVE